MSKLLPCLDIDHRKVVKGTKFKDVKEIADPLTLAKRYAEEGADELVFYDISASYEGRGLFYDLIEEIRAAIDIPLVVGGGIRTVSDAKKLVEIGADKVSINSIALTNPSIVREMSEAIGKEKVVVSLDVQREGDAWILFAKGGRENTGIDALAWAEKMEALGAGELVINSIDEDGVQNGYNIPLMQSIRQRVNLPIIASGGAGKVEHFVEAITDGGADGVLAASVFHFGQLTIPEVKEALNTLEK